MYIRIYLPDIFNNPSPTKFRSFRSTRLIKLFLQRLSPPPSCEISLRQLTLIYLAGMVKQFDVNFVGIEFGWKSWTAHFHTATYLLVKGPAGIFCKRDYIAHVETGSNNSLWERVSWKIEFPSQMLTLWLGPVTGRALQLTCIRRALRNSRQRLFFSPTCWRIGSLYFHYRSNWITAASFFFSYIVRILFSLFLPDLYLTAIRYTRYTVPWKGETKVDLSFISTVSKIVERVETLGGFSYKIF